MSLIPLASPPVTAGILLIFVVWVLGGALVHRAHRRHGNSLNLLLFRIIRSGEVVTPIHCHQFEGDTAFLIVL